MNINQNNAKITGLIFDFGGTIDTNGQHWGKMLWYAYQKVGIPVSEENFREAYVYGERTLAKNPIIQPHFTLKHTAEVKLRLELEQLCIMGAWNVNEEVLKQTHKALSNVVYQHLSTIINQHRPLLTSLSKKYPIVLVTNFYGNMHEVLHEFNMESFFDDVVESSVIKIRKPDERIYKIGLQKLQIPAENVLAIGDSFYKDIEPAKKVGCQTAWLKGEGWTDKQYDETIPTYILHQLDELSAIL